ncbi:7-deoxyloganetic acid glucosyltransferase-like [Cornus florida]|uniref:7-deoxyloganetic acid glucosyltransferase-like n=1 Tax=Cornus florida TaxID=4283 RepID=UPI0028964B08|nr:7-deoxyloganetic acid glucosyltransferase-like [Cornus florida]
MDVPQPHAVILPFPAQGHIKPMLMLAKLLSHANFYITFVNTLDIHNHFLELINQTTFNNLFPRLRFMAIPDGLPPEHPRSGPQFIRDLFISILSAAPKHKFRDLLLSLINGPETGGGQWSTPTCVIADGLISILAIDVAEELHIPVIAFRTVSASSYWVYLNIPKLIEEGLIPFQGDDDMDGLITCIPGFQSLLRRRDLPSFCRFESIENPVLQFFINQTLAMTRASALILNTFDGLESPIISKLLSFFPKIYTIGPLHALLESRIKDHLLLSHSSSNGSLREQDRTCLAWLDSQPSKSVVYINFGSLVMITPDQLMEFWYGLVNSEKPFLWVIREDLLLGEDMVNETPQELTMRTRERGCIVGWAPQEEILAHRAVGGFLTHSGWNSTLESIWAGVPMICWPQLADQQVNSRCVSELWKLGIDIKDTCDRSTVEKVVRDLIEGKREEIMKSSDDIARMARDSVREGGSSYCNLEKLVDDIRSFMSSSQYASSECNEGRKL